MTLKDLLDISVETLFNVYDENDGFLTADWHDKDQKGYDAFKQYLDCNVVSVQPSIEYDEENISDENPDGRYSFMKITLDYSPLVVSDFERVLSHYKAILVYWSEEGFKSSYKDHVEYEPQWVKTTYPDNRFFIKDFKIIDGKLALLIRCR